MAKIIAIPVLLLCLFFLSPAAALNGAAQKFPWSDYKHPVKFTHLSVEQGLSQGTVLAIFQDHNGFIWLGTENGLNRYDGYHFNIYRPDPNDPHSISDNIIQTIFEDSKNRLWFGARSSGLNLFDHHTERFTRFRNTRDNLISIIADSINCIIEDSQGNLLFGTGGGGISILPAGQTPGTFENHWYDPGNPETISNDNVTSIYEISPNTIWVGTDGGGLNKMVRDKDKTTFVRYQGALTASPTPAPKRVLSINRDHHDTLWLGTPNGLYSFDPETERFTRFPHLGDNRNSTGHNYIRMIYKDRTGLLWLGTDGGGLDKLVPGKNAGDPPTFKHYRQDINNPHSLSSNAVESIFEDRTGVLWIGTYRGGLNLLVLRGREGHEREREQFVHYRSLPDGGKSLSNNTVNAICEDSAGTLWIGTDGGGLNRVLPPEGPEQSLVFEQVKQDPRKKNSISDNIITCITEDHQGGLWVGTYTGGLNRLLPQHRQASSLTFQHYTHDPANPRSLSHNFVMSLHEDRSGYLWAGTIEGGLNRFDRDSRSFAHFKNDPENESSLSDDSVFAILEDRGGRLWVGTTVGLNCLRKKQGTEDNYNITRCLHDPASPGSINNDFIRVIFQDGTGTLWFGTNGGGLDRLNPGENGNGAKPPVFSHYTEKDGLPSGVIAGILEDRRGHLWVSTQKGLCKFNPKVGHFKLYDKKDGLQGNEFNPGAFARGRRGDFFFGGTNGFNIFHPGRIRDDDRIPPIVLTDIQLFNQSIPIGNLPGRRGLLKRSITHTQQLTLSYKDYVVSFHFAALHYANPSGNRFSYIMEGLETNWNQVGGRNFATYTTLPPGTYRFKVKGCNNDGIWNETGVSLEIEVTPPFWKTWWFYGLMFLLVLLTFIGAHLYRVRRIIRKMQKKYEKTALSKSKADAYLKTLLNYMKIGKPYLDPELNMKKLSKLVSIPSHSLSQIINDKLDKIFFDFINQYRIEEALKKLKDPKQQQKNIQDIAGEVGFNSQSAFNRAFKKFTNSTPSDYISTYRIEEAARRLADPAEKKKSIQQIARETGFNSPSTFNRAFKKVTNDTPSQYRAKKLK